MSAQATSLRESIAAKLARMPPGQLRKVQEYVRFLELGPLVRRIDPEQAYFWTEEWQAKEREADRALAEGRVRDFVTMDGMVEFLDAQ